MNRMRRLLGVGSALVDHLALVPESFLASVPGRKGGTELVDAVTMEQMLSRLPAPPTRVPGGSAANTVVGAARLGLGSGFLTKTGVDEAGRFYRRSIAEAGVRTAEFKTDPDQPTGRCLCLVTPDSQRTMRTHLGAAETLAPGDISPADFRGYDHVHVEGYMLFSRELMFHVLRAAAEAGCTVSLDLAAPEIVDGCRALLPDLLREYVDMVFANEDEAAAFSGSAEPQAGLVALASCCELVAVKLGARGALIRHGSETVAVPALRVQAVDTTGAGDLWAAGFLAGLLSGRDLAASGRLGARVAAAVVQVVGAVLPEATWNAIRAEV
jgi:sugar/nucleoside kinase (ribokinase family)